MAAIAPRTLTAETVRSLLTYSPETGEFHWRVKIGNAIRPGMLAGGASTRGYHMIRVRRVKYLAHRLAWLYVHGVWPMEQIDHKNGCTSDNRLENLRLATDEVNHQNLQGPRANNQSGYLGVTFDHTRGRFRASIVTSGKRKQLGRFDTAEEASAAYLRAKRMLHEGCTI